MFDQIFGHPTTQSSWDIKLAIMHLIQKLHLEITGCYGPFRDKNLVTASSQCITQIYVELAEYTMTPALDKKGTLSFWWWWWWSASHLNIWQLYLWSKPFPLMLFYRQEGKICKRILDNIQIFQGLELLRAQSAGVPYVNMEHSHFIQAGLGKFQNIWTTDLL